MSSPRVRTAAALIIGNELLSGKVSDANVAPLARMLRRRGVRLLRVVMVLDEVEVIAGEIARLAATHDFVFTSGGVGPTHDDVTIEAVARAFNLAVVLDASMEAMLRAHYGDAATEGHLRMARVPESAELRTDEARQCWPIAVVRNVWVLPGVPQIFDAKLAIIEASLGADPPFLSRAVYSKLDEGVLKPLLDRVVAAHPRVEIGSYPEWNNPIYRTKLTFDAQDGGEIERAVGEFVASLPAGEPQRVDLYDDDCLCALHSLK